MRPLRSFRLRIALLTAAMAGLVLAAYGVWASRIVWDAGLTRADDRLIRAAMPHFARRPFDADWLQTERGLADALAFGDASSVFLRVSGKDGAELYRSDDWPAELTPERLPAAVRSLAEPVGMGRGAQRRLGPPGRGPAGEGPRRDGPPPPSGDGPPLEGDIGFGPPPGRAPGAEDGPPPMADGPAGPPVRAGFRSWEGAGAVWRLAYFEGPRYDLAIGFDLGAATAEQRDIGRALTLAALAGFLLLAGGSFWIAQRAIRPVAALADRAERITAQGLHERLPVGGEAAEFERLVRVFNAMLERLEGSFRQATRFSADAAHELKTPITIVQGLLDEGIRREQLAPDEEQRYRKMLDEMQRLKGIIQKLLTLSLADAGRLRLEREEVDLSAMLRETAEDIEILAPSLSVTVRTEDGVVVDGDSGLLRQAFQNLVNNAIQYNVPNGRVWIQCRKDGAAAEVMISNTGPAIPEADRERIFQRFHRVDAARGRETGGAGLGLSLVRELIHAHGGTIALKPDKEGVVSFLVRLPAKQGTASA